ncbi:MAG: anaerobic glycerol-3-phosphate dehydrogenase subunit GlpB [Thermodesulfobacteriota bacterium]|nr:anaerobic glycerol-3-phosphate dehydrogenase subunit GlpB [Thermodesulfobacteriota bacterium]
MHYDLIIIGMGLSGLTAAKTAAEAGCKVLIIGKGMGSLSLFTNTIDVLGKISDNTKMSHGLSKWIKDHPEHPYSKVGLENIEEALSSFLSLFPPPYSFHTIGDGNCLIPTGAGTHRPAYLIPNTMLAGTSLKEGNGLIVGFKGFKDFYAGYVADQLRCRSITLTMSDLPCREITAMALARQMEKESFREKLGREIKTQVHHETRVGFPALLGIRNSYQVMRGLEEFICTEVFEIPILPPSIPGMRIFNRFKEWLIQRGVNFLLGYPVSTASLKGRKCEGIYLPNPPVSNFYSADRYILATGRFIGGGLVADGERIFEPIFNLPVVQPKSREEWFGNSFFNDPPHPIHQAGILTDSSLRPVDEKGRLILENVWVAGSILAHHHCIDEKSREGIEIATGYTAARHASGS